MQSLFPLSSLSLCGFSAGRFSSTSVLFGSLALASLTPLWLTPSTVYADVYPAQGSKNAPEVLERVGSLMLRTRNGQALAPATRLGTDMTVTVSGPLARITVTQAFRNTSSQWVEASYLFPMPEDSAVDSLKMVVGDRIIIGEIQQRQEARQTYETARAAGQTTSLMEQQRPNMFSTEVANIGPRETILISIEYQVAVEQSSSSYGLRLPLVVAPRYVPPDSLFDNLQNHPPFSQQLESDTQTVTAPVGDPASSTSPAPLSITVHLNPGFSVHQVASPSHTIHQRQNGTETEVTLTQPEDAGNRDFILTWTGAGTAAQSSLFSETWKGERYVMAVLSPPPPLHLPPPPPRELIFVIDNSGSMGGESIEQAKASLTLALRSLSPNDTFNIIRFDDSLTNLFGHAVAASAENIAFALGFTASLQAEGGTEMVPALAAALVDTTPQDSRLRQVIFLTDGAISNESKMLEMLGGDRGRSRVFMVGIGSAPNSYLMGRMAEIGLGRYLPISDIAQVEGRMKDLLTRLTQPAVTDLQVISSSSLDLTPTPVAQMLTPMSAEASLSQGDKVHSLPDLYAGETISILGRTHQMTGIITVTGRIGDVPWSQTLRLNDAQPAPGVAKQWARRRITDISLSQTLGSLPWEVAQKAIGQTGVTYQLVTSETSLVAVDHTPRRPAGTHLTREELPLPLPKGWDFDSLFGLNKGETAASTVRAAQDDTLSLPQTGTLSRLLQILGLGMVAVGSLGLFWSRRRTLNRSAVGQG